MDFLNIQKILTIFGIHLTNDICSLKQELWESDDEKQAAVKLEQWQIGGRD